MRMGAVLALGLLCAAMPAYGQDRNGREPEKAVAEAVAKRRINESRALILAPWLDDRDVGLLSDVELDSSPTIPNPVDRAMQTAPSTRPANVADAKDPVPRYRYWVKTDSFRRARPQELKVDPGLQAPRIDIDLSKSRSNIPSLLPRGRRAASRSSRAR